MHVCSLLWNVCKCNYSGLNQYFPRNALFLPPEGGRNSAFRVGKIGGLSSYLQITYAIGGSVAAMCYSVAPRLTQDVDVMVDLDLAQLKLLVAEVERWESYLDPLESIVQDLLPMRMPINILDGRIGARADVYVVKHDGLDASAMQRRRRLKLYTRPDVYAWVLAPEDVILYKLLFFAASRGVSQKHVRDIHGILRAIEHDLDTNYLNAWTRSLNLYEVWQQVLMEYRR